MNKKIPRLNLGVKPFPICRQWNIPDHNELKANILLNIKTSKPLASAQCSANTHANIKTLSFMYLMQGAL